MEFAEVIQEYMEFRTAYVRFRGYMKITSWP
jgi:hypothetical protein